MSEVTKNPDEQASAEAFRAPEHAERPVAVDATDEFERSSKGKILDNNLEVVDIAAKDFKNDHDQGVTKRDMASRLEHESLMQEHHTAEAAQVVLRASGWMPTPGYKALVEKANEHARVADTHEQDVVLHDNARKAALWDSQEHLKENRGAYEQAALEDAQKAGKNINFGPEQQPAPTPQLPDVLESHQ